MIKQVTYGVKLIKNNQAMSFSLEPRVRVY